MTDPKPAYTTRPPIPTEHQEQCAVFDWAANHERKYPALKMLFAIPNGGQLTKGGRSWARLKAEGARKGVLDICLPVPMWGYHGLWIEMKRNDSKAKPTKEQQWWLEMLTALGYYAVCRPGADEAIKALEWYLGSKMTERAFHALERTERP